MSHGIPAARVFIGGDIPGYGGPVTLLNVASQYLHPGKKSAVRPQGASVYLVNTVKTTNPNGFERFILNDLYDPVPFCEVCAVVKGVFRMDPTLIFHKNRVHFSRIELKFPFEADFFDRVFIIIHSPSPSFFPGLPFLWRQTRFSSPCSF
jgi:hypothetical protein